MLRAGGRWIPHLTEWRQVFTLPQWTLQWHEVQAIRRIRLTLQALTSVPLLQVIDIDGCSFLRAEYIDELIPLD